MSESQTGAENLKTLETLKLENVENIKNDSWDMLNNFCFHVYAQKLLFLCENCNAFLGRHQPQHPVSCPLAVSPPVHRSGARCQVNILPVHTPSLSPAHTGI